MAIFAAGPRTAFANGHNRPTALDFGFCPAGSRSGNAAILPCAESGNMLSNNGFELAAEKGFVAGFAGQYRIFLESAVSAIGNKMLHRSTRG